MYIQKGKTGPRRVRVINVAPLLANWIQNHPLKQELHGPVSTKIISKIVKEGK